MPSPAEVFKCLADETRVRATLLIVDQGELCVCELMCALADSQPKISRHLAQLRSAGLLLDRRQGQWVYYRLNLTLIHKCGRANSSSVPGDPLESTCRSTDPGNSGLEDTYD